MHRQLPSSPIGSAACAPIFPTARSRPSPQAPRSAFAMTSSTSSSCAIRTNASPASIVPDRISRLRPHFPARAIAAFTASATQRVRHDIIHQLELRDPHKCIASFHRPNLRYVVRACDAFSQTELLLRAMRSYGNENIIVYAPTIAKVESTVDLLQENGIPAIGYHGQMNAADQM